MTPLKLFSFLGCPVCGTAATTTKLFDIPQSAVHQCKCGLRFLNPCLDPKSMSEIYNSSETLSQINPACTAYYEYNALDTRSQTFKDYQTTLKKLVEAQVRSPICHSGLDSRRLPDPESSAPNPGSRVKPGMTHSGSGKEMLEAGCGRGNFLAAARDAGWNVYGIDSSAENIKELQSKGIPGEVCDYLHFKPREKTPIQECPPERSEGSKSEILRSHKSLPQDDEGQEKKFDVVVLWDFIEHPQDPVAFVKKASTLLKEGGLLCIATPRYPNLLSLTAEIIWRLSARRVRGPLKKLYFLEHTTYFGDKTLRQLLEKNGFRVDTLWTTETDLKRYTFPKLTRWMLRGFFGFARLLGLRNRLMVIARKTHTTP